MAEVTSKVMAEYLASEKDTFHVPASVIKQIIKELESNEKVPAVGMCLNVLHVEPSSIRYLQFINNG